jgi:hypothetical protein
MSDQTALIVGFGEIGKAVKEAICPEALVFDISQPNYDKINGHRFEVMHICFPYSDNFVQFAQEYIDRWQPEHIAIWSTLPIGTTKQVSDKAVHSFVEGRHPVLAKSIRLMPRWVGHNDQAEADFFKDYFESKRLKVRLVNNTDHTEALKLMSTTKYGINLVYTDYVKRIADDLGMDFELTKQLDKDYNQLYKELGMPQFQKFVLDAPNGAIGGHCVRENSILLNQQYPDMLLERINAMRKPQGEQK